MKFNKKIVVPIIILIIIIVITVIYYINTRNEDNDSETDNNQVVTQDNIVDNTVEEQENIGEQNEIENTNSEEENERINSVKSQYGFTGDNSLYTESNNELSIKPSIAYRTGLIGSIEQRMPTYSEINSINVEGEPTDTGIWVSPASRNIFLSCINSVENLYEIDENGYLTIKSGANSKYAQKINEIERQESLVIVDMTGIDYIVDVVTGDIFKNEFEAMDPYQVYEYVDYEEAKKSIIFLNSNQMNRLTNQEIIDTMMQII